METLTFGQGHRPGQTFKNGSTQAERKYVDFIVSGQSLGQVFGLPDLDMIGTFGWTEDKELENKTIDEFIGKAPPSLDTGRTMLYVCPECGHFSCGAITAKIEMTEDKVIWKDFAYENDISGPLFDDYKNIQPIEFNKTEYIKVLEQLRQKTLNGN